MLTYGQLAEAMGMREWPLRGKINRYNKRMLAMQPQQPTIDPDKIEDYGYTKRHLFKESRVAEIKAALLSLPAGKRGNPNFRKDKTPS